MSIECVDKRRLEQSSSLRVLCAVALSETSTAPCDLPPSSLPLGAPFDITCGSTAAPLLPVEASRLRPAGQDVGPVSTWSPTSFEGVYASRAGFGAELIQKGANRLWQTGFRTSSEAALERARWLRSLEQSAVSNSAAIEQARQATTNRASTACAEGATFSDHSLAPSNLQGKLGNLADHKLSDLHGQLEHKKRKLELTSRSTPTWAARSESKAASPALLVSSLTTSQLLAASHVLSVPAALPILSTMGPSPPSRVANLVLSGMQAMPPPYPAPEPQPKRLAPALAPAYPSPEPKRACLSQTTHQRFCREQRPLLPATRCNAERERLPDLIALMWKQLPFNVQTKQPPRGGLEVDNKRVPTPVDKIRSTSSWAPPGIASRPITFGESVAQLRTCQTADEIRGYVSALSAASGAAAAACGAATEAGVVAGTSCRSVKVGGGAIHVTGTTPPGTLQERFAKYVMCGFTPRRPCELPMSNWVSCDELIGLLQPHAPAEVLGSDNLKQLITEWYKDHPAYADLPFSAWCKKLTDKTRRSDPRQARKSRSNVHFKFPFQCTPCAR